MKKIVEFYELHNFDETEFKDPNFCKQISSDKLVDNLSEKCLAFINIWKLSENKVNVE